MEKALKEALLSAGFKDDEIVLETTGSGKVAGYLISPRFAGQSQLDRQDQLWTELRERLAEDELVGIVSILTMTPDEVDDDVMAANG